MVVTTTQSHAGKQTVPGKEGKYLTFALAHEGYGLKIVETRDTK